MRPERPIIRIYLMLLGLFLAGCTGRQLPPAGDPSAAPLPDVRVIRYTIQVGAFSNQDNALRLTRKLKQHRIDAYHFIDESGLYKVRFGNFSQRRNAERQAVRIRQKGIVSDFYIVRLTPFPNRPHFQERLVRTAEKFIGVPYKWGGESRLEGFDCSGLTMTVYKLNGLELPRSSRQQWRAGRAVGRRHLKKGDLVFFATSGGRRVSHVGIYAGNDRFIHAPRKGRKIRYASLDNRYYRSRYLGARRYI